MSNNKFHVNFLLIVLVGVLLLCFFILTPFSTPLVAATIFAIVLQSLYKKILTKTGGKESTASFITLFLSIFCILVPLIFLGSQIFKEAIGLYTLTTENGGSQTLITTTINSVGSISENMIPGTGNFFTNLSTNLDSYIKKGLVWLINHLGVAVSGVSGVLLDLFIFIISLFYLLRDGKQLKRKIIQLSPLVDKEDGELFDRLESAVNSVIRGSLLVALIQGVMTSIGFTIFGIPNSILWGTLTMIAALIPGIGTSLVLIPGIIYLFAMGNTLPAIGLIIWGVVAVGLIDNILGPKLVGQNLRIHPLLILLSVLGGISFFGPIGIFLGPITMSLLFALLSIYIKIFNKNEHTLS